MKVFPRVNADEWMEDIGVFSNAALSKTGDKTHLSIWMIIIASAADHQQSWNEGTDKKQKAMSAAVKISYQLNYKPKLC